MDKTEVYVSPYVKGEDGYTHGCADWLVTFAVVTAWVVVWGIALLHEAGVL